jgi:pimeloyl-ACP methyl ester carboxylesterase
MSTELLEVPMITGSRIDVYSGVARLAGRVYATIHRPERRSGTVLLVNHPTSNFLGHYALRPLAARGVAAVGMTTRYVGNDSALTLENCLLDVGAVVRYLREEEGFQRVVLLGNSGGGGLSALYQSQAESPTITATPAGDPPDLTTAGLPPADGVITFMAHPGRASVLTEWLDPAIVDENNPLRRAPALDLFSGEHGPPFSAEFLTGYRDAQVARNRRITAWVRDQLELLARTGNPADDLPFVVHGTCADPRSIDANLDPSDREMGTLWGPPQVANLMPSTLAHHTSLRSWLSQWSIDDSNGDGPRHIARVSVPVLVMYGTGDNAAFPAHSLVMHEAAPPERRRLVALPGANHYFKGQPDLLEQACDELVRWLRDENLV